MAWSAFAAVDYRHCASAAGGSGSPAAQGRQADAPEGQPVVAAARAATQSDRTAAAAAQADGVSADAAQVDNPAAERPPVVDSAGPAAAAGLPASA